MLFQRSFLVGIAVVILIIFHGCAQQKPVTDLSRTQEGKIYFTSTNTPTFKSILFGGESTKPVSIFGMLEMPRDTTEKVPAVIILHGMGGLASGHYFEVARDLNEIGIAAFVIDSQKPRGVYWSPGYSYQKVFSKLSYSMRVADAYAALKLLSTHPRIDKNRIALMGWSRGGDVALLASSERVRKSFCKDSLRFAATVVYYPSCFPQYDAIDFGAPILMLLAEKDNSAPPSVCIDYAERMKSSGTVVKILVYKDAHHGFDISNFSGTIQTIAHGSDVTGCKDRYLLLQDDGTWLMPRRGKTVVSGLNLIELFADCLIQGKATFGGPSEARKESIKEYQAFLKRIFKHQ